MSYFAEDDIAQIATPPGPGLVGALRLSGPGTFAILADCAEGLDAVLAGPGKPARGVHPCRLRVELSVCRGGVRNNEIHACPARAFLMPGPASYTREDVAELHLPGAPLLLRAGLEALVRAGARPAAAGEFTVRAFRNGRLGLAQAEAVEEVVKADGEVSRRAALSRLSGDNAGRIGAWRDRLLTAAANLEAILDFPVDVPDADAGRDIAAVIEDLEREGLALSRRDDPLESGLPHVALVGLTNAGKSSLFNALVGHDAALASPEASTTHDALRREVDHGGVRLSLSDNPGFHPGAEGRARLVADRVSDALDGTDVCLWVVDGSRPLDGSLPARLRGLPGRMVVAVNKSDLASAVSSGAIAAMAAEAGLAVVAALSVSAVTGAGVGELLDVLAREASRRAPQGRWNRRQRQELVRALEHGRDAAAELSGHGRLELAADDLRRAVEALSLAMGEGYGEEALARIFSGFCIGK